MRKQTWKLFPLDWLLLSALVYSAARCLQTAYDFPVQGALLLWCACLTGLFCALFRLRHGWAFVLSALALLALGCVLTRDTLRPNFLYLLQTILGKLDRAYAMRLSSLFSMPSLTVALDFTPTFLLFSAVLSFAVCASVVWLRRALPAVLFCVAAITPCFFLTNIAPQTEYLVLLIAGLLVLVFSQRVRRRAPEEAHRAALYALLPAALTVALLLFLFPEQTYEPPLSFDELVAQLNELGDDLRSGISFSGTSNSDRVDLRSLGPKRQLAYEAMRVTVDGELSGYLYLRGTAYEDFDGESWQVHDDGGVSDGALLGSVMVSDRVADVSIRTTGVHKVLYTPDHLVAPDVATCFDYYVPNEARTRSYDFRMYLPVDGGYDSSAIAVSWDFMYRWRNDAAENCLALPAETKESLLTLAAQYGLTQIEDQQALISAVTGYVRSCAVYDLSPDTVPTDEDFCTWFLTEAGRGYCVHFATATTAMLRALGVPARYVEGYITDVQAGQETVVEERQAHAWVEVYDDSTGWQIVDPTPPSGVQETATPSSTETPTTPTEATEPTSRPTAEATEPVANESTAPTEESTPEAPIQQTAPQKAPIGLWVLLGVGLGVFGLWLLRVLRVRHRRAAYAAASGNHRALLDWRRYVRLCRVCGAAPEQALEDLAKKAKFSQHRLTEQELQRMAEAVSAQETAVRHLPVAKRLWYTYWLI